MKRTLLGALALLLIVLLALQAQVSSQSATFAWNASPSPGIVGYEIHFGAARGGPYSQMQPVGNVTRATVSGLPLGETIYFAVKAVNDAGLKSPFSNEVAYLVAPPSTPTPTPTSTPSPTPTPTPSATPQPPQGTPSIVADRSVSAYYESITATVNNPSGSKDDYYVFCSVSEPVSFWGGWRYLNDTRIKPAANLATATVRRDAPNYDEILEFRLYSANDTLIARSAPITIRRNK
jgi:hypothetical protein